MSDINEQSAVKTKAQSLADKMNSLTEKFNLSEEMVTEGADLEAYVQEKTKDITLSSGESDRTNTTEILSMTEYVNLEMMVQDFKYVRETLRETTDNGRRVLQSVTLDLLEEDEESRASLITSFAELNKAVADNMRLYMQSYRDISTVLLNLDKIIKTQKPTTPGNVTNNTVIMAEPISTSDLIKQLGKLK